MGEPRRHLTVDDYMKMPDPEDGSRYEIIDGELYVTPAPIVEHQYSQWRLSVVLSQWVDGGAGGLLMFAPMDVHLARDTIVQPDILWISPVRQPEIVKKWVYGAPDLLVEILSPSTARRDRGLKAQTYARFGVREYWIADPKTRTLEIFSSRDGALVSHAKGSGADRLTSSLDAKLVVVPANVFQQP